MNRTYVYKHNPIVKKIFLAMLLPTILMNLTTAIGSVADTIIIGQYLDDLSLSVVTFATPVYMVINTFAALFAVGGCIAMGIDTGKGDKASANQAFSLSVELLAITGILFLLSGFFLIDIITHWLGAGEDVFESVREYTRIVLVGGPVFVMNIGLAFFVRNDGRPTLSMIGMFSSIAVDIILNFVFVGFLGMGVSGAAYSTVLGQLVSIIVIGTHFFSSRNTLKFRFVFNNTVFRIFKNGFSSALHFVYQFLTILIMNHFISRLAGVEGIVVYTVVFNLSTVSLSVFEGISQTIQPMVSNYFGEKSCKNIRETLRLAFITVLVICGSVTLILEIVPGIVPVVFGIDDASVIEQSALAVRIFATSMIIMTINVVIGYYLQSTEQNFMSSVIISLRCFVLFLGVTFILGKFFGTSSIWAAYTIAELLTFVIIAVMVQAKRMKMKKSGMDANCILLDNSIEKNTVCFTCKCSDENFDDFIGYVGDNLKNTPQISDTVCRNAITYLAVINEYCHDKNGKYTEVEINGIMKKVTVRDNLEYSDACEHINNVAKKAGATSEPVLGWNRVCFK